MNKYPDISKSINWKKQGNPGNPENYKATCPKCGYRLQERMDMYVCPNCGYKVRNPFMEEIKTPFGER